MRIIRLLVVSIACFTFLNSQELSNQQVIKLDLDSLVQNVVKRNAKGLSELINVKTKQNEISIQKSIYEPVFNLSVSSSKQESKTSPEDSYYSYLDSQNTNVYESKSQNYEVGFTGLLPTGGTWGIKAIQNKLSSNVIEKQAPLDEDSEFRSYLKLEFQQPLLKNAGTQITSIQESIARVNSKISVYEYENLLTELVGVTIQTYWQLYGEIEIVNSWSKLIEITNENIETLKKLVLSGKIPQTEIYDIENRLLTMKLSKIEAQERLNEKKNQLLSLLNLNIIKNDNIKFILTENIEDENIIPSLDESFTKSLKNWPEYNIAKKNLELEKISKKYIDNQSLPTLNLIADISNQALEHSSSKSLKSINSDDYQAWNVGLEFSMPIFGNKKMKYLEKNARLKLLKQRVEINSLEKNLANSLHSRIEKLKAAKRQVELLTKSLDLKNKLLEVENEKFSLGKVSIKEVLKQEFEYIEHKKKIYEMVVKWKTAEAILQKVMGQLLDTYEIEVQPKNLEKKVNTNAFSNNFNLK
ncbi:MAG: TolC family protein [Campylobacterota bacterium]